MRDVKPREYELREGEFWCYVTADAYDATVQVCRRQTAEEAAYYRPEIRSHMGLGVTDAPRFTLKHPEYERSFPLHSFPTVDRLWQELRSGASTRGGVTLPGGASSVFLLSIEEAAAILEEYEAFVQNWHAAKAQAKAEAEAARAEIFERARTTGKRQEIERWMTSGCTKNLPDCSFDCAIAYALPDGTEKIEYTHAF